MRLLNAQTLRLEEFVANVPPYTILSHCWGTEEVAFEDVHNLSGTNEEIRNKAGWRKVRQSCRQTLLEGFRYIWVDTCCINKSSSAELSEAINSMFRWYRDAAVCFAYLDDVTNLFDEVSFHGSRWFTRGWTLQELIAPREVMFFEASWQYSTTRRLLADKIHQFVGIDAAILLSLRPLRSYSVAQRFSWAARRRTTRIEDQAYSLLGLFDVHMPLLYGEGTNAFLRLQEEVLRVEQDLSILAWSIPRYTDYTDTEGRILPLAPSLTFFSHCDDVASAVSSEQRLSESPDVVITAHSLLLTTRVVRIPSIVLGVPDKIAAILNCRYAKDVTKVIAMELYPVSQASGVNLIESSGTLKVRSNHRTFFLRDRLILVDTCKVATSSVIKTILIQRILPWSETFNLGRRMKCSHLWIRFDDSCLNTSWKTQDVFPKKHWTPETRTLELDAAFAEERSLSHSARPEQSICAAIVLSDGIHNQIVIYLRVLYTPLLQVKIEFRVDHYHPEYFAPLQQTFEGEAYHGHQVIRLCDGTWFMVRRCEDLVTDTCIAHLAISLKKCSSPVLFG